jgi:hypothetical protein
MSDQSSSPSETVLGKRSRSADSAAASAADSSAADSSAADRQRVRGGRPAAGERAFCPFVSESHWHQIFDLGFTTEEMNCVSKVFDVFCASVTAFEPALGLDVDPSNQLFVADKLEDFFNQFFPFLVKVAQEVPCQDIPNTIRESGLSALNKFTLSSNWKIVWEDLFPGQFLNNVRVSNSDSGSNNDVYYGSIDDIPDLAGSNSGVVNLVNDNESPAPALKRSKSVVVEIISSDDEDDSPAPALIRSKSAVVDLTDSDNENDAASDSDDSGSDSGDSGSDSDDSGSNDSDDSGSNDSDDEEEDRTYILEDGMDKDERTFNEHMRDIRARCNTHILTAAPLRDIVTAFNTTLEQYVNGQDEDEDVVVYIAEYFTTLNNQYRAACLLGITDYGNFDFADVTINEETMGFTRKFIAKFLLAIYDNVHEKFRWKLMKTRNFFRQMVSEPALLADPRVSNELARVFRL